MLLSGTDMKTLEGVSIMPSVVQLAGVDVDLIFNSIMPLIYLDGYSQE